MASATPHTILLQVNGVERSAFEKQAGAATVKPGHLLAISGGKVVIQPTAKATLVKMVAIEHGMRNTTGTTTNIDTAYPSDDTVPFVYPQAGDLVYMFLEQGESVTAGDRLEAADGGELQAYTDGYLIGVAEETVNATAEAKRIKVRIA